MSTTLFPILRRPQFGRFARGASGIIALLLLWQISVPLIGLPAFFYPAPSDVVAAFVVLVRKGILPVYIADSLGRYLAGVAIGSFLGIALGLGIGMSRTLSRLLGPFLNFLFSIVEVAWIPVFVLWWGYGIKTILVALTYVVAFPVLFNTAIAVRAIPAVYVNAVRSLGGTGRQVLWTVILPGALPGILTGLRVGAGFAFRGLIFAEMIAAKTGIGYLIITGAQNHATDRTVVGMIVMGVLWLLIDGLYLQPLARATVERWGTVTVAEHEG